MRMTLHKADNEEIKLPPVIRQYLVVQTVSVPSLTSNPRVDVCSSTSPYNRGLSEVTAELSWSCIRNFFPPPRAELDLGGYVEVEPTNSCQTLKSELQKGWGWGILPENSRPISNSPSSPIMLSHRLLRDEVGWRQFCSSLPIISLAVCYSKHLPAF